MRFSTYWHRVQGALARAAFTIGAIGRSRWRFGRRRRAVLALAAASLAAAMALVVASALGVLAGSPSEFEANDGNLTVDQASSADWNCFTTWPTTGTGAIVVATGSGSCSSKIDKRGYFQEFSNPAHVDPTAGTTKDLSWKSGQKQDTQCPSLEEHKPPAKDTLTNVGQYVETEVTGGELGATYLYGATSRSASNGNSSENIELNQVGPSKGCSITRTQGDHLIAIDYKGGGSNAEFHVLTWVSNATGSEFTDSSGEKISGTCKVNTSSSVSPSGCWSETVKELKTGESEGSTNTSEIKASENGLTDEKLTENEFAEFGVNLAKAGILPKGTCEGFADTVYESRSSGSSFTSNPEDIEVVEKPITNCGTIKVIKVTSPTGVDKVFSYTSTLKENSEAGGVNAAPCTSAGIASSGEFCLNAADSATGGNKVAESGLPPTTYKITEAEEPSGFVFEGVKCVNNEKVVVAESTSSQTVSLPLHPEETIECTYKNREELGALKIIKENSKSLVKLAGAEFEIENPKGTKLTNPATGNTKFTTDSKGEICVDNLTPVGEYTAEEIKAPSKFGLDPENPRHITVKDVGANGCKATTFAGQTLTFLDPPLTDLAVTAKSEVASPNNTKSTVECSDNENNEFSSGTTASDPATASHNGYLPGTYTVTCKVTIDP